LLKLPTDLLNPPFFKEKGLFWKCSTFLRESGLQTYNLMTTTCRFSLFLFFFLSSINYAVAQSNEGTEFWFGFMEHVDVGNNSMVAMVTSKTGTSGTIRIPGQNWSQSFTVGANDVRIIDLPSFAENLGSEEIQSRGIQVETDQPSSVYIHQFHSFRSEATVVLPNSALGNEYYVMTYTGVFNQGKTHPAEFLVVALQDETEVMITVSDQTEGGKTAGTTFTVLLNRGETYQVQAAQSSGDLTGSFISSDKRFNVFGGNSWTQVPSNCEFRDNLLEQMYPVSTWGKQFVTVPNDRLSFDVFRILAAEDGTNIEVQGSTTRTYNLNAGEFAEYQQSEATYILATKPITVAQYIPGQACNGHTVGDPSMVLLNAVEQTRDTVTLFNSSFERISENFINVITRTVDVNAVIFDGQPLINQGINFSTVGPNGEFSYARIPVSTGAHTIISEGCGVIATAYGYGQVESYAYSGGASFSSINANPIPEGGCLNDTILFDTGLSPFRFTFDWQLGDGTTSNLGRFTHFYPDLGAYPIQLILYDQCLDQRDTFQRDLLISLRQAVDVEPDILLCEGEAFQLGATDLADARYEWHGPNGYFSESQFPIFNAARLRDSGRYEVVGIVSGCATFPATQIVNVQATPVPDLGPDTLICSREDLSIVLDPGDFSTYLWQDFSRPSVYEAIEEGIFWVEVTDELGCEGSDTLILREQCPTALFVPNVFTPNDDGINDEFRAYGHDIISYQLRIYSRWGALLFESNQVDEHWDGYYDGEPLSSGVYTWVIELEGYLENGEVFTETRSGTVTLWK